MSFKILYYIIKVKELNVTCTNGLLSSRIYSSGKMFILGNASRLIMFIVTFSIILRLNQVTSMKNEHIHNDILCNSEMMKDLYSRIQVTPLIFLAKVLRKEKIPSTDNNWQLVAYVKVLKNLKDIFTPQKLLNNFGLWIGPFTDQINNTLCMPLLKNNSRYIFFASKLSKSINSFQSLFVPINYSASVEQKIRSLMSKPMKPLVITSLVSYTIIIEGKIDVECHAEGFPIPQYFWFKNHKEPILKSVLKSRVYHKIHGIKSILHIENVERTDEANYTCHAENIFGYVASTFKLKVQVTEEFKHKCNGVPFFCINGICKKDKVSCSCYDGFEGRRCNYYDPYYRLKIKPLKSEGLP